MNDHDNNYNGDTGNSENYNWRNAYQDKSC